VEPLSLSAEWELAPGVSHPVLAKTWARLEISVGEHCVTRVFDRRANGSRQGVYGSVFPLAEWIVNNYWFLMSEGCPAGLPAPSWIRRHSLVAAREGGSLPALSLFRDEDCLVAKWMADDQHRSRRPVAFVETGDAELEPSAVRASLTNFVDLVIERLRGVEHPEVAALRADWEAVTSVTGSDAKLCARAASIGVDAFDAEEMTEQLAKALLETAERLEKPTRADLLDAGVSPNRFAAAVAAVVEAVGGPERVAAGVPRSELPDVQSAGRPYEWGYALARAVRHRVGQQPSDSFDLETGMKALAWADVVEHRDFEGALDKHVKGIVGVSAQAQPKIVAPPRPTVQERFLVARGMYLLLSRSTQAAPRLITDAGSRTQAASRAFAAELLAPIAAIRARAAEGLDDDLVDEIAAEFQVAPAVINYQVQNQGLVT
jgi:hypothetical protein